MSCHSSSETIHAFVPVLEGQPKAAFMAQWQSFRDRKRTAPAMLGLAEELRSHEVEDLADYYSARVPPPPASAASGSEAGRALADGLQCGSCHGPDFRGTSAGVPRLAGQRARYPAWSLQLMRGGTRSHAAAGPDPVLVRLTNAEIDALAAHFASLR